MLHAQTAAKATAAVGNEMNAVTVRDSGTYKELKEIRIVICTSATFSTFLRVSFYHNKRGLERATHGPSGSARINTRAGESVFRVKISSHPVTKIRAKTHPILESKKAIREHVDAPKKGSSVRASRHKESRSFFHTVIPRKNHLTCEPGNPIRVSQHEPGRHQNPDYQLTSPCNAYGSLSQQS